MSRNSKEDFARDRSQRERRSRGLTRRMRIRSSSGSQWQVVGYTYLGHTETPLVEPFTGVGFYSRPRTSSASEAVVITIGDAQHSVIIATRDEELRRLWKAELDVGVDVAAMFNSATIVLIKPSGEVEIRSRGGEAVSLAKLGELQRLADDFYNHGHPGNGLPPVASFIPPALPGLPLVDPGFAGTSVLKSE